MSEQYEPLIIAFCCNWCAYAGADLAGVSRIQYPSNARIIRVMCSGMVHPNLIIDALTKGADGLLGNTRAQDRAEGVDLMLEDFGLEPERFRVEWISSSEAQRFADIITEMTEVLKDLGPSPYSTRI
jgi:F420-non-reducing hydrogenase iron-sulfur subunit